MNKISKTILFFGNERLATGVTTDAPILRSLASADYHLGAVVVAQNHQASHSRKSRLLEISEVAASYHIPVISPGRLRDNIEQFSAYQATVGILVAYGKIIPQEIIDCFEHGIINIHPSLLPRHRGPTPIESALLAGESQTGVTLMQLSAELDSGPILAQKTLNLDGTETKQVVADRLSVLGRDMLLAALPRILQGDMVGVPQDPTTASYDQLIRGEDGYIDNSKWIQLNAETLSRQVRAYSGWPRSRADLAGYSLTITAAHAEPGVGQPGSIWSSGTKFGIYCAQGILVVERLIIAGKPEMTAEAFLAGHKL